MSKIGYCKRGGMDGIKVTETELKKFARSIGSKNIDEFIPLPHSLNQSKMIHNCTADHDADFENIAQYWEDNKGSHGWCCSVCGEVLQWG